MINRVAYLLLLFIPVFGFAQVPAGGGLIVNEINQGTGLKEFMEFVVLGDPLNPCAYVDLTGWVFDDNNGTFETCGTGVGIASGHYRFTTCYNAVPPGSILVVYNVADPYVGMPPDDPTDADGDGVYIIPSNSTCLEANYSVPISIPADCNYSGAYSTPTLTWAAGMANSGDVAQVRKPDYSFFHGFSYGDVNTVFPAWPSGADAGTSFNKGSGNLALDCGSCWSSANYITTTAGAGTPGAANTVNNGYFIDNLINCTLNYDDLNDIDNCDLLLPIYQVSLMADVDDHKVQLTWSYAGIIPDNYIIYSSRDGKLFDTITSGTAHEIAEETWTDNVSASGEYYYQISINDIYGETYHSKIVSANVDVVKQQLFPNPATTTFSLLQHPVHPYTSMYLINMEGETLITAVVEDDVSLIKIDISDLPPGHYLVCLTYEQGVDYFPVIH